MRLRVAKRLPRGHTAGSRPRQLGWESTLHTLNRASSAPAVSDSSDHIIQMPLPAPELRCWKRRQSLKPNLRK